MPLSRRSFLIGGGAVLTTGFLADARACWVETGEPLLIRPPVARQTLFAYQADNGERFVYQLSLGEIEFEAPEPPTWRAYLLERGEDPTGLDADELMDRHVLTPEELDQPIDAYSYESTWEAIHSPSAKAYHLLDELNLGPRLKGAVRAGRLNFERYPNPCSSAHWVEADDGLTLSLLQARLRELELPIEVRMGGAL